MSGSGNRTRPVFLAGHVIGALAGFAIGCLLLGLGIVRSDEAERNILEMLGIWKPRDRKMY